MVRYGASVLTDDDIILFIPTSDHVKEAHKNALKPTYRTWSNNKDSAIAGALGEIAFRETFQHFKWVGLDKPEYDFDYRGIRVELKTKLYTVDPSMEYKTTVAQYLTKTLACSHLAFAVTRKAWDLVYLMGAMRYKEYMKRAEPRPEGTRLGNGLVLKVADHAIKYKLLSSPIRAFDKENMDRRLNRGAA